MWMYPFVVIIEFTSTFLLSEKRILLLIVIRVDLWLFIARLGDSVKKMPFLSLDMTGLFSLGVSRIPKASFLSEDINRFGP